MNIVDSLVSFSGVGNCTDLQLGPSLEDRVWVYQGQFDSTSFWQKISIFEVHENVVVAKIQ